MDSEGITYGEELAVRRPAYGDGRLTHELREKVEDDLGGAEHWRLAVAIFTPVVAAYGGVGSGLYLAANSIF
jgi:hypothetical protein